MACAGAFVALAEPLEFTPNGVTGSVRVAGVAESGVRLPLSPRGRYWVTWQCYAALTSVYARVAQSAVRAALFDHCDALADTIVREEPLNAFAFLVKAIVAGERNDAGALNAAMAPAYDAAPYEGWLSRMRVFVGELYYDQLDEAGRARHGADLAVTLGMKLGLPQVAATYVSNPERRDGIVTVVETLDPTVQAGFVSEVQRLLAGRQ